MTPKQARFVEEYLIDLNAAAAARRAGYSVKTADAIGRENLGKPTVAAAIAAAQQKRSDRTRIDADWVLRQLAEEKAADLSDLFDDDGNLLPVKQWPAVWRRGPVVGVEAFEEYAGTGKDRIAIGMVRKVKLTDRTRHLELIGKHVDVGAFRERVEHTGRGGGPIQSVSMTPDEFKKLAAEVAGKV